MSEFLSDKISKGGCLVKTLLYLSIMRGFKIIFWVSIFMVFGCQEHKGVTVPLPIGSSSLYNSVTLEQDELYDKVLGALVGSAIGDAMGASTEMWYRADIQEQYGYINGLTNATRVKSPEGTWRHNMIAGSTTDDTRWKFLMGQYIQESKNTLNAGQFADFIANYYQSQLKEIGNRTLSQSTDLLDEQMDQIDWIKEWARVAMAYQKQDLNTFQRAQSRFYGGEMSCAGMLYAPMFGLIVSEPTEAYELAFDHALFDIGYAKDISALTAAMTNMAMRTTSIDSIINVVQLVDPYDYKDSRLIGRLSEQIVQSAFNLVVNGNAVNTPDPNLKVPSQFVGSELEWSQLQDIFRALEGDQKAIAFHAGEIFQILIAGLYFGDGDFEKTMQFIVNYGRDNDTVAAVAGLILGAKDGFSNLPMDLRNEVVRVNREVIGIDLELLAKQIVEN